MIKSSKDLLFSQRIGITPLEKEFQLDSMDEDLRIGLWNGFYEYYLKPSLQWGHDYTYCEESYEPFFKSMWKDFFKLPTDEIPYDYDDFKKKIKDGFSRWKYYNVYDFIDWVVRVSSPTDISSFINHSNKILERENSGYRFVGNHLTSITDKKEIKEIETVMQVSDKLGLTGVKSHIECALQLLSDRGNPDYKNSF